MCSARDKTVVYQQEGSHVEEFDVAKGEVLQYLGGFARVRFLSGMFRWDRLSRCTGRLSARFGMNCKALYISWRSLCSKSNGENLSFVSG